MCRINFMVVVAMFWMALSLQAQSLPVGMKSTSLNKNSSVFGDLNFDDEVNVADINVLIDIILGGNYGPKQPNMTIAEFKAKHWQDVRNYVDTITEDEVIHGWVTSSDRSGNIYKSLYIMDESGAGLFISINRMYLFQDYPIGQEIILPMKGYWVGKYNGQMGIGYPTYYYAGEAWEISFLPYDIWCDMAYLKGDPDPSRVAPVDIRLEDIVGKTDAETQLQYQNILVRVSDVSFAEADGVTTYSGSTTTNRTLVDADGNEIYVRNSSYADFAGEVLPRGTLDVVGELVLYGSTWQLYLRDINDVTVVEEPIDPDVDPVTTLNEGFDNSLPETWTSVVVSGDKKWYQTIYAGNGYAAMTGYKGNKPPFDAWLVSPALDIAAAATKTLSFRTEVNAYGSTTSVFEVYVLNHVDPSKATVKVKLNPALATAPASGYSGWEESGALDLSQWADGGKYYIGFRYYAEPDNNYATWCLDDVKFGL